MLETALIFTLTCISGLTLNHLFFFFLKSHVRCDASTGLRPAGEAVVSQLIHVPYRHLTGCWGDWRTVLGGLNPGLSCSPKTISLTTAEYRLNLGYTHLNERHWIWDLYY